MLNICPINSKLVQRSDDQDKFFFSLGSLQFFSHCLSFFPQTLIHLASFVGFGWIRFVLGWNTIFTGRYEAPKTPFLKDIEHLKCQNKLRKISNGPHALGSTNYWRTNPQHFVADILSHKILFFLCQPPQNWLLANFLMISVSSLELFCCSS